MTDATNFVYQHALESCFKYVPVGSVDVGRILAEPVIAACDIPRVRTSIMDGYAVIAADGIGVREVIGSSTAGSPFPDRVTSGKCVRISTGANVPDGADAVVMVEYTNLVKHNGVEEMEIEIHNEVSKGQSIRLPGSDIKSGSVLLQSGCVVGPAEIGIMSGSGQKTIAIYRKPKLCVMSTGNELVDCSADELAEGQIRDTNRPQLMALFQTLGFKPIDAGIAGDTRSQLVEAIKVAFQYASVLVTSGGVSMGEKDLLKEVLQQEFGFEIHFGRVFMKPGLPATFASGSFEELPRLVFALPGNPVSSWVCAQLFAVPCLWKTAGRMHNEHTRIRVQLGELIRLDARPEYRRAWLQYSPNGPPVAITTGNQISSRLMSTMGANLLLVLPPRSDSLTQLELGSIVDALVIAQL